MKYGKIECVSFKQVRNQITDASNSNVAIHLNSKSSKFFMVLAMMFCSSFAWGQVNPIKRIHHIEASYFVENIMKKICLILSLWLASLHIVMATVQDPEYAIMGGASYWMKATFPIEEDSILSKIVADELETLRGSLRYESSSCHRDYWGYWSIEDGYLYLDSLDYEPYNEEQRTVIDAASLQSLKAFVKDGRVMAQWFSAEFEIYRGRLLRLVSPDKWIETHEDTWNVSIENGCIKMIKKVEILLLWKGNDNPQALIEIGRNLKNQFPEVKNGLKVYCNGGVFDQLNNLSDLMIKIIWPQDIVVDEAIRQSMCDEVKRQFMDHQMISTYLYEETPLTEWKHWEIDL